MYLTSILSPSGNSAKIRWHLEIWAYSNQFLLFHDPLDANYHLRTVDSYLQREIYQMEKETQIVQVFGTWWTERSEILLFS